MKNLNLLSTTILIAGTITLTGTMPAFTQTETRHQIGFSCGQSSEPSTKVNIPTTFAQPLSGNKTAIIVWKNEANKKTSLNPTMRCQEVAKRFQLAYDQGVLEYLTYGQMNNQQVICATQDYGGPCQQLILTLKPEDKPMAVLNQLNSIIRGNASKALIQSTGEAQIYIRFNVQEFVNQASPQKNN